MVCHHSAGSYAQAVGCSLTILRSLSSLPDRVKPLLPAVALIGKAAPGFTSPKAPRVRLDPTLSEVSDRALDMGVERRAVARHGPGFRTRTTDGALWRPRCRCPTIAGTPLRGAEQTRDQAMNDHAHEPHVANRAYRVSGAILGVLLVASGIYVLWTDAVDLLALGGVALLIAFGGNLLFSAWRGRASWLGKLGPLP